MAAENVVVLAPRFRLCAPGIGEEEVGERSTAAAAAAAAAAQNSDDEVCLRRILSLCGCLCVFECVRNFDPGCNCYLGESGKISTLIIYIRR